MSFTVESMPTQAPAHTGPIEQNQFDLPVKEFMGYDPKGTMSVTGSPISRPDPNATQSNKSEETKEESLPTESVALSPKISAIARKEAAQRQREQALLQREKSLEAKLANAEKYEKLQAKIASKDYSAADELGLSYEEYTNYLLNKQAGEKPEEQRFRQVEEKLSQFEKAQEEKVNREYEVNQSLWKKEISKVIAENDAFLNIRELKAEDKVLQHINDSFDQDDVELTVEEAAKDIEEYLDEYANKIASLSKVKGKFNEAKTLGPPRSQPKTITNQMAPSSTKQTSKPFHLMSESEQIAEAYRRVQAAKLQR